MIKVIKNKLHDIFIPKISEINLLILVIPIILSSFIYRYFLINSFPIFLDLSLSSLLYVVLGIFCVFMFIKFVYHLFSDEDISSPDKRFFAIIYYIVTPSLSIVATVELLSISQISFIKMLQIIGLVYIVASSIISMITVHVLKELNMTEIYSKRFINQQMSLTEILVTIITSVIVYLWVDTQYNGITAVALSYLYMSVIISIYPQLLRFLNIKNE